MKPALRIMLVIYCLLFTYCCVWIPWRVTTWRRWDSPRHFAEVTYSLLWLAPGRGYDSHLLTALPDIPLITLRILALTALAIALVIRGSLIESRPSAGCQIPAAAVLPKASSLLRQAQAHT